MSAAATDVAAIRTPDPSAFDLEPQGQASGAAVLCIHGLTGTPWEVRPLGEELARRGFRSRGPVLPGHDGTPAELAQRSYHDWVECSRREFRNLRRDHERVYVAGLSLGGLLTLLLASEENVPAIATIGTPLRFRGAMPLVISLGRFLKPMLPKKNGSDIVDPSARSVHPGMAVMPMASVHELVKLQKLVCGQLARVTAPLFIGHGSLDHTARPADADEIASGTSSHEVVRRFYERSGHVVPVDFDGADLACDIGDFFMRER